MYQDFGGFKDYQNKVSRVSVYVFGLPLIEDYESGTLLKVQWFVHTFKNTFDFLVT